MDASANPFAIVDDLVADAARHTPRILVDFHAEATSEKVAMGQYLDGRVTAIVGTHTHVQTADERVLAGGSAYITDLGMTGPHDSVIGVKTDTILNRFLTGAPGRFEPAEAGVRVQGVVITATARRPRDARSPASTGRSHERRRAPAVRDQRRAQPRRPRGCGRRAGTRKEDLIARHVAGRQPPAVRQGRAALAGVARPRHRDPGPQRAALRPRTRRPVL